jgi:hypothetical protein
MSDTLLILHVKGTEAETTALPRHAVQAALSQGQITNSQLIWSVADNTWKQIREMPDFVPVEQLILHVKGTEAETRELPKPAVRVAISQGQITHSQLIWSPVDNSWKQAREFPDLLPSEHLILHVKGTEAETKELPKRAIRTAISKGEITHSQLIWSPNENSWKQVRELPDLLPSQKLAPAPPPRVAVISQPRVVEEIIPESPTGPVERATGATVPRVRAAGSGTVPRVRVAVQGPPKVRVVAQAATGTPQVRVPTVVPEPTMVPVEESSAPRVRVVAEGTPQVRVAAVAAQTPQVRVAAASESAPTVRAAMPVSTKPASVQSTAHLTVKEDDHAHPLKWVCIGLGIFILVVLAGNYLLVDRPLFSNMEQTSFSNETVYAHFGAFVQPNVVVIHIPSSTKITADNLTDFLVALARSTPENPLTHDFFARVALTSGWTAQYSFAGNSWKELGDMDRDNEVQRKDFLISEMCDGSGQPLVPESTLSQDAQQTRRDQVWAAFVAHFTARQ